MIESVLKQHYSTLELIIVNDGSTDNSLSIIQEYALNDTRIKVIDEPNSGKPSIVRNKGIKVATGDFITFLDADDIYSLDRLQLIVDAFTAEPDASIVIHDFNRMSEDGKEFSAGLIACEWHNRNMASFFENKNNYYVSKTDLYLSFLEHWFYVCSDSIAIRVKDYLLANLLFDETLLYFEDLNKWSELVVNRKVVFLNEVLASYRRTPGSLMSNTVDSDIAGVEFFQRHLNTPLIVLPKETHLVVQLRLIKEIEDAIYGVANKGLVNKTLNLSLTLLKTKFSFTHVKTVLKHLCISIYKRLIS
jgi:glycosyltransferase involved in cell wall biosynthesis